MDSVADTALDLQSAADQLGVHYQTAYRWVRSGRLPAEMINGKYLVSPGELAAFDRTRRQPTAPPAPKHARLEHATERLHAALVAGDETTARRIVRRLHEEGAPIVDLIEKVLAPPLRRIGEQWQQGHVTVSVEHRASAIVERLLGELAPNPKGRRRGVVVVAAIGGDRHSLPTSMAAVSLRADNWNVQHLGADLPAHDLLNFCQANDVTLAVITVTNPAVGKRALAVADQLRSSATPTIIGGGGQPLGHLIEQARSATH